MRTHFISRLALLFLAGFLAVASQVWSGDTLQWLFVGGGAAIVLIALIDSIGPSIQQRALDGVLVLLGAWTVVEAFVFENSNLEWWSFASAAALAGLAAIGLTLHEASTERVVHELSVKSEQDQHVPAAA
jgi:peptidoglycan/LPS O-acetylase OafA/YrhL